MKENLVTRDLIGNNIFSSSTYPSNRFGNRNAEKSGSFENRSAWKGSTRPIILVAHSFMRAVCFMWSWQRKDPILSPDEYFCSFQSQ
jgi:hypothetical protein